MIYLQVGLNLAKMSINNASVVFWDLGGQKRLRTIWKNYYNDADGLIFVIDASKPSRIPEVKRLLQEVLRRDELCNIPVLLCANKTDQPLALNQEQVFRKLGLSNMIYHKSLKLPYKHGGKDRIIDNFEPYETLNNNNNIEEIESFISKTKNIRVVCISALKATNIKGPILWLLQELVLNRSSIIN